MLTIPHLLDLVVMAGIETGPSRRGPRAIDARRKPWRPDRQLAGELMDQQDCHRRGRHRSSVLRRRNQKTDATPK